MQQEEQKLFIVFVDLQTLTPYLSVGGDGASPAAGRAAGRAGAGGG